MGDIYAFTEGITVTKANERINQFAGGTFTIVTGTDPEYIKCGFKPVEVEITSAAGIASLYTKAYDQKPVLDRRIITRAVAGDRTLVDNCPFVETLATGTVSAVDAGAGVGLDILVGVGTLFTTEFAVGDFVQVNGETRQVESIASATSMTVTAAFTACAGQAYYLATPATDQTDPDTWVNQAGTAFAGIFPVYDGFVIGSAHSLNVADTMTFRAIG